MLWSWWAAMAMMGCALGALGARAVGPWRGFMHTLAIPIALVISRLAFPVKDSPNYLGYLLLDLVLVSITAYLAERVIGRKPGRRDRTRYRNDSM